MGAFVVAGGDGFETFLTGCVPDLKFDYFTVDFVVSDFEIDTNCWHEAVRERIILKIDVKKIWLLTANLTKREDLPTPEFPIRSTLKR